jgi:hypothetical protein
MTDSRAEMQASLESAIGEFGAEPPTPAPTSAATSPADGADVTPPALTVPDVTVTTKGTTASKHWAVETDIGRYLVEKQPLFAEALRLENMVRNVCEGGKGGGVVAVGVG